MEEYWALIQERICRKCLDGDGKGNCRLPRTQSCALRDSLPAIVRIASETEGGTYEEYLNALRAQVCARCEHQRSDGSCPLRVSLECALDRYYVLVLDVVDEVRAGTFWSSP